MKTTAPCYLEPGKGSTEFMRVDGQLICFKDGKGEFCYCYDDIPKEIVSILHSYLEKHPKYIEGLKLMHGNDHEKWIYQLLWCKFSSNDHKTDFPAGEELNEEFVPCERRGRCIGEKYLCKLNKKNLTDTEIRVAKLLALDLSYIQIADKLRIKENTVRNHTANILKKTGCSSRSGITKFAVDYNIIKL